MVIKRVESFPTQPPRVPPPPWMLGVGGGWQWVLWGGPGPCARAVEAFPCAKSGSLCCLLWVGVRGFGVQGQVVCGEHLLLNATGMQVVWGHVRTGVGVSGGGGQV